MLRLPTLVNFPLIFWNKYRALDDEEEAAGLLVSSEVDETSMKHRNHGAITTPLTPPPVINEMSFAYPNTIDVASRKRSLHCYAKYGEIQQEIQAISRFALPLIVTFLLGVGNKVVDVWFLGKVGSEAMAVASLGNLFTTIAGLSVGMGILTAIDTLVAQAFTGASNPHTVGIILQRALAIIYIFGVFITATWCYSERILLAMGQSPELARKTHEYILLFIPNIFSVFTIVALRKFLQGLGEMKVTMYLLMLLFPINVASNYFFLIYMEMGIAGAAYHGVFVTTVLLLVYILFIFICTDAKKFWPGFTKQAFCHWGEFLKLGIPGMLSVSVDWAFEVCAIITGVLGQTSLAAQSVVISCISLFLMIPSALTTALVVRLGHHLGANQPKKTKLCVMLASTIGLVFVFIDSVLLYVNRSTIAHTFSKDDQVVDATIELLGVGSLAHFAMGFGIVLSGTLNALGKQHIVACFNIVSYYAIGLPVGLYLTSKYNWGLIGVWSGVVIAGLLKSTAEAITIIFFIDWKKECIKAAKRINKQEI
ncbi:mate-domain-containing protein [Mucor lusitanicus]|nr:mate-domain-containing protein [Mucor lusitanicus]